MPVEIHVLRITSANLAFYTVFVDTKCTSNMAACYINDVGDVTAPYIREKGDLLKSMLRPIERGDCPHRPPPPLVSSTECTLSAFLY